MAPTSNFPAIDFWTVSQDAHNCSFTQIPSLVEYFTRIIHEGTLQGYMFDPQHSSFLQPVHNTAPSVQLFQAKYYGHLNEVTDLKAIKRSKTDAIEFAKIVAEYPKNSHFYFKIVAWKNISEKTRSKFIEHLRHITKRNVTTIVCDNKALFTMYGPSLLNLGWFMDLTDTQTSPPSSPALGQKRKFSQME